MSNVDKWLKARMELLTASDCAAVLGLNPYATSFDVWAVKTGKYNVPENDAMRFGKDVEPAIANIYAKKTGRAVVDPGDFKIFVSKDHPWLGATLDRVTEGSKEYPAPDWVSGPGSLELKSVGGFKTMSPDEWEEMPPQWYVCQLQIQMHCAGHDWGSLAGLFPGYRLAWKDIERDDSFLKDAIPRLEEFWFKNVKEGVAPDADVTDKQLDMIKQVWSKPAGKKVELDNEALSLWNSMQDAKKIANEHYKTAKIAEAKLRKMLEDAEFCGLPDGTMLQLKEVNRKGYTVEPKSYTQLKKVKNDAD